MAIDARLKGFLRRLARPLWRRIWVRIEARLMPIDDRISSLENRITPLEDHMQTLEDRITPLENRIPTLEDRITPLENHLQTLEVEWQENMPALLNTVSTVGAFGHELVHIRRDLEEKIAALRQEFDAISREMRPDPESRHSD